jgi:general secretion pathway protein K
MPPAERGRASERGAALLTVLLLVAVISVLAATALERLRLSTRLAANAGAQGQAQAFARAAEAMAVIRVGDLLQRAGARVVDTGWSGRPFGLPLPGGGAAVARVTDGGNCFNLNGLVTQAEPGRYVANPVQLPQFARLIRLVAPGQGQSERIAAAAADWIDSDDQTLPNGTEDATYQAGEAPYRTANTLMADASELRAVAGVTPQLYAALRPFVCALPRAQPSALNVDTLTPEQAPLVAMLLPDTLSVPAAQRLLNRRPPGGWENPTQFWAEPSKEGITVGPEGMQQTAVTTRWFALAIGVRMPGTTLEERALIDATALPPRLVSRAWGEPG